jgi:hypothetical protein
LREDARPRKHETNHFIPEVQTTADPEGVSAGRSVLPSHNSNKELAGKKSAGAKSSTIWSLDLLAKGLTPDRKSKVERLLHEIPEEWMTYTKRRREVGLLLRELQQVFASAGRKGRFEQCLGHLHIPKSTAYDLLAGYETLKALPPAILDAADEAGIDLGSPKLRPQVQALSSSLNNS